MTTIKLNDTTAKALAEAAQSQQMSVEEFVRLRVLGEQNGSSAADEASKVDFDSELNSLLFPGPTLPADFSRADIYSDHE